ncbi:MAG TPA: methyltransferase domain-containing protein [Candidatus Thermoplasmatota archaeon]|nr:methyltransferase domain-containing protein [Candidatus Thermoplasmatota archaeon]
MNSDTGEGRFAGLYDLAFNPVLKHVHQRIVQLMKNYECQSIVDLGSGTGALARTLAKNGFSVTGIDTSSQMIAVAREKSPDSLRFIHADITSIDHSDMMFDAANISLVLHPNSAETITKIVMKAKKLIKPNGVIFITDYGNGTGFSGKIASGLMQMIESFTREDHRRNYFSFMKLKGIHMFSSWPELFVIENYQYFHGALQTIIVQFEKK